MEIEDFEKYNLGIALRKSENSEIEDFGLGGPWPHPPPYPTLPLVVFKKPTPTNRKAMPMDHPTTITYLVTSQPALSE